MRNISDTGFTLPPDAEYLEFPRSDGTVTTWPGNTTRVVDHEGCVNYYDPLGLNHGQHIRWRILIGEAVALEHGYPKGKNYVLKDFPANYRLFDHNKGAATGPRHDLYLYGPIKKKFRSVNEFIPHAIWLFSDGSQPCKCKYCGSVKMQREITASMSNILRTTPTGSPSPSRIHRPRDKGKGKESSLRSGLSRNKDGRAYAAVQRTFQHLKPSPGVLKQPMLQERASDLRAVHSKTSMHLRRWFREQEVVWCALETPIKGPTESANIEFWPGIVDEVKLKTETLPAPVLDLPPPPSSARLHSGSADSMYEKPAPGDTRGPFNHAPDEIPWTVRQSTRYKVQLLAVAFSYTIDDEQVLPYQAYVPPDDLIHSMVEYPAEKLNFDKDVLAKFNPCPGQKEPAPTFVDAVPAYATAIQIASILSSTWCLTDDYEFHYSIPQGSPKGSQAPLPSQGPSANSQSQPPLTLQDAIEQVGRHNAQLNKDASASQERHVEPINPDMSPEETQKVADRVLGAPPAELVQTRFQGLWWGAERIWVDDFIRLKVPRRMLAPKGAPNILAPSGPGKSNKELWEAEGKDPAMLGAGTRGVFLRLDGLLTVDVPNEHGVMKKEARVCGMLYELADEDWDETDPRNLKEGVNGVPNGTPANPAPQSSEQPSGAGTATEGAAGTSVPSASAPPSTSAPNPANGTSTPSKSQQNGTTKHIPSPTTDKMLPQAPIGYKFRPIIAPGYEFVGAMGLISGRYYPRILLHPKITPQVRTALLKPGGDDLVTGFDNLWALEGLSGGYFNSVDPHRYKKSRLAMVQDATKEALEQLQDYAVKERAKMQNGGEAMDVDADVFS
ncbi:hypothetical protein CVT26_005663 [Gymnopilus dilepis]|uniref:Cryptic loci regulator 2 N-terminal domain-containing protein n=1 Tax=Gymnopilus dilepis TaxID=231916 RepID=A0A409XZT8_9AGAR|nr:hypothetical protein CVT26_005663 [Gymnopilus dilepis]